MLVRLFTSISLLTLSGIWARLARRLAGRLSRAGVVSAARGMHRGGVYLFSLAMVLNRRDPRDQVNRSLCYEALGDWPRAWRDAEARRLVADADEMYPHQVHLPRWDGRSDSGLSLFVHWEQGYGDILQHCRFLHVAAERTAVVVFECPPALFRLLENAFGPTVTVVCATPLGPEPAALQGAQAYVPLASLASVLGGGTESISRGSYLSSTQEGNLLPGENAIAYAWRSSTFDTSRSMPVECGEMARELGFHLWPTLPDIGAVEQSWIDARSDWIHQCDIADFADVAAIIRRCNAVLTVDTATAHLAGALGTDTWLLLGEHPAPRWGRRGTKSVWYPTVRIVRKRRAESWQQLASRALLQISATLTTKAAG